MSPALRLHVPSLREMAYRQGLLADPATMAWNAGRRMEAPGYDASTGCIDFPPSDWRWWREVWLWREPERFSAYLQDAGSGAFVGEVSWWREAPDGLCGAAVLVGHAHRGQGFGSAGLRLLCERAFAHPEVEGLFVELPETRGAAVRACLAAGFSAARPEGGGIRMEKRREEKRP